MPPDDDIGEKEQLLRKKVETFYLNNQKTILLVLVGIALLFLGVFFATKEKTPNPKVEILGEQTVNDKEIIVEIAGAVLRPGVYKLANDPRIEDLLIIAGGLSEKADRLWVEKNLNRAAKLIDGQKIYIPRADEQSNLTTAKNSVDNQTISTNLGSSGGGAININTASQKELESLEGIGPVYAQNIIEHRPYSNTEELVSKDVLKKSLFEKIKNKISV